MDGERLPEFGKSIHRRCGEGFPGCRKCPRPREWAATVLTAGTSSGPTLLPSPAGCSAGSADSHGSEHPPIAVGHANGLSYGHQPRERIPFPSEWERRSIFVAIGSRRGPPPPPSAKGNPPQQSSVAGNGSGQSAFLSATARTAIPGALSSGIRRPPFVLATGVGCGGSNPLSGNGPPRHFPSKGGWTAAICRRRREWNAALAACNMRGLPMFSSPTDCRRDRRQRRWVAMPIGVGNGRGKPFPFAIGDAGGKAAPDQCNLCRRQWKRIAAIAPRKRARVAIFPVGNDRTCRSSCRPRRSWTATSFRGQRVLFCAIAVDNRSGPPFRLSQASKWRAIVAAAKRAGFATTDIGNGSGLPLPPLATGRECPYRHLSSATEGTAGPFVVGNGSEPPPLLPATIVDRHHCRRERK